MGKGGYLTPKSNLEVVTMHCADEDCSFRINMRSRKGGVAEVTGLCLKHTCGGNAQRQREPTAKVLRQTVPGLENMLGQGHRGDGKQVTLTQRASCISAPDVLAR